MKIDKLLDAIKMPNECRKYINHDINKILGYLITNYSDINDILGDPWTSFGFYFLNMGKYHEAILLHQKANDLILDIQKRDNKWYHKAPHTVMLSENYFRLNLPWLSNYYLFLASVDDLLDERSKEDRENKFYSERGIQFRFIRRGLSLNEIESLTSNLNQILNDSIEKEDRYPEIILGRLTENYFNVNPAPSEINYSIINKRLIDDLYEIVKKERGVEFYRKGWIFEDLAKHLLLTIPGINIRQRVKTKNNEIDFLIEYFGQNLSNLPLVEGYFICECKNTEKKSDVTDIMKFIRLVQMNRLRLGVFFSWNGLTEDAENVIRRSADMNNITVVVIDKNIIDEVRKLSGLLPILKREYERVRFDLPKSN